MQGESDTLFNLTEAIATYEALDARGVDVNLVFNWGGHGYQPRPGEGDPYSGVLRRDRRPNRTSSARPTWPAGCWRSSTSTCVVPPTRTPGWRGSPTGSTTTSRRQAGRAAPAYRTRVRLPRRRGHGLQPGPRRSGCSCPPRHRARRLHRQHRQPCRRLATRALRDAQLHRGGTAGGVHPSAGDPRPARRAGLATADAAARGRGNRDGVADVANANSQDAFVFVKLYDVAPDGTATLIRRLVTASRIPAEELPGTSLLRLPGIVHRFEVDHRVRLVVATTDDSYRNPTVPDQVTLASGGTAAAIISLPTTTGPVRGAHRRPGPRCRRRSSCPALRSTPPAPPVLAAAGDFPDALAAGGLAAAADGPLLLTGKEGVRDDVLAELRRLGVDRVYVAGGPASLSAAVEADLAGLRRAPAGRSRPIRYRSGRGDRDRPGPRRCPVGRAGPW